MKAKRMYLIIVMVMFFFPIATVFADQVGLNHDYQLLHEKLLYPIARVSTSSAGGSGAIVYSKKVPGKDIYESYVLTNWHVISDAISVRSEWDSSLGINVDKEVRETVNVEIFHYSDLSLEVGRTAINADIVAYSKDLDLALLKLRSEEKILYTVVLPKDGKEGVTIFEPVISVGASLGHKPIPTKGMVMSIDEEIDNRHKYIMVSSPIVYGNSGGATFRLSDFAYIGIPSRGMVIPSGWFSSQILPHLAWIISTRTIYDWLKDVNYHFIYDDSINSVEAEKLRLKDIEQKLELYKTKNRASSASKSTAPPYRR